MCQEEELWVMDEWDHAHGRGLSVKVSKHIETKQTPFQKIDVYDTESFGKMLVLDGTIHVTEFDEFAYHEMIAHVPLAVHPEPKRVLIIGGGDGGAAREVLKHASIKEVHLCEIDKEVIRMAKKHLPFVASSFDHPKLHVFYEDGAKFIQTKKNSYDVIIVDSPDPWGPAEVLFQEAFYQDMFVALTSDGIAVTQSESMFYNQELIQHLFAFNRRIYPVVIYYFTLVPTYPSGTIGFSFCSKKYDPVQDMRDITISELRYYTPDIHKAAFMLPQFMDNVVS